MAVARMTDGSPDGLLKKCLSIYRKKRSLKPVSKFIERIIADRKASASFFEDHAKPMVRKEFFPDITVTGALDNAMALYRREGGRSAALCMIWEQIDWEIPLTCDEYEEFVERLEHALVAEPNPPTKEDWACLEEWLVE